MGRRHVRVLTNDPSICHFWTHNFLSPAGAVGPGDIATPPVCLSVRPSVTFSFRTVTQKLIAVFSRNFAGMCTK